MPVKINGVAITPAPLVTVNKTYVNSNGVGAIGAEFDIVLNGTLIAYKGNPESSGSTPTVSMSTNSRYTTYSSDDDTVNNLAPEALLNAIMKKQERLRAVVASGQASNAPLLLEVIGYNENKGLKAYCSVDSISFDDQSRWTQTCGYTISLKANELIESANGIFSANSSEDNFAYHVSEASESWSLQEGQYTATAGDYTDQVKTYSVSHTVSAVGIRTYSSGVLVPPIDQAIDYVTNAIGLGSLTTLSFLPAGLTAYNQTITEQKNEFEGSYSVTEEFFMSPQSANEICNISIEEDTSAFVRVGVAGTITGLDSIGYNSVNSNKYDNALAYWNSIESTLYSRAEDLIPCTPNTVPLSKSVGKNITEGVINYSYTYDNRPINSITNARTEDIQVTDTYPGQLINVVPVIGRSQPIIQYVNSRSEYKRSLQINALMGTNSGCTLSKPASGDLVTIFNLYKPSGTKVYYSAPQESWNPRTGNYSYSIDWTYEL
jgi:hypothetical protein